MKRLLHSLSWSSIALSMILLPAQAEAPAAPAPPPDAKAYRAIAQQTEASLVKDVLTKWYPRAMDREHGGFYQNYDEDWTHGREDSKGLVYQSRLTWVASQAAQRYPDEAELYREHALHGVKFLRDVMWDKERGGLYWSVDLNGKPNTDRKTEKHAYGMSFAIYASVAAYKATKNPQALDLAKRTFSWLEKNAHDARNGGYYEALTREGKPIMTRAASPSGSASDEIGTEYGFKSMNTHIHLLEAFTSLYQVWPDAGLHKRLQEIFHVVRDKVYVEPGCLNMFFNPDWSPVPGHDSFGHDIETAFLLVEAAEALEMGEDTATWTKARKLVDHALDYGFDNQYGGFYDAGLAFSSPSPNSSEADKIWWTQAEGLNALLLIHQHFGKQSPRYWQAFVKQWDFIQKYQIDHRFGGWHPTVKRDGTPLPGHIKSDQWTEAYHQGRALLNVTASLRRLASRR